MESTQV